MLAAFGVVFLGFWPTFYQPLTSGTTVRNVHGVTSTLWYMALVVQPWLVTNGYVRWHRRVAVAVIALLPVLVVTALMNTRMMLTRSALPPAARPLIAYLDVTLVALFIALFLLGLRNRRTPAAHKRYMVSTALVGFPPAITRFVSRTFGINPFVAINISFFVVELILITLIVVGLATGRTPTMGVSYCAGSARGGAAVHDVDPRLRAVARVLSLVRGRPDGRLVECIRVSDRNSRVRSHRSCDPVQEEPRPLSTRTALRAGR